MSVLLETTLGELVIDLEVDKAPQACINFLKLCKLKYYNFVLVHSVQKHFVAQMGDPSGKGTGGNTVWGIIQDKDNQVFEPEIHPKLKHNRKGIVSMALVPCDGRLMAGSQFLITLVDTHLEYLDRKQAIFGQVAEGFETLDKINDAICDQEGRPYRDIRIKHTIILDDPFDDPEGLVVPIRSPIPSEEMLKLSRIGEEDELAPKLSEEEADRLRKKQEAEARALTLEMIGDLPFADIKPPENILFICKLNPVTRDEDLELIFSRFGNILSCEIIRDKKTQESLGYSFIEFETKEQCEEAYFKMDNVLIDDRRIHVDFSQSVSKLHREFLVSKQGKNSFGDGLEKRQRYRDEVSNQNEDYDLVFEHGGDLHREKQGKTSISTSDSFKKKHPTNDHRNHRDDGSTRHDRHKTVSQRPYQNSPTHASKHSERKRHGDKDLEERKIKRSFV
ncbi:hypothetical protein BDV3_003855 [Batrachochytrium dendrobatidis]|uniref:Peptidyl-prolyl cis-trans isomerase n=1 Tax=Batrachochytrium dendrobatidis (strain JEL423) TaxID=403673 RepID=A0A177WFJ0_BATDL|nr:Peptidyl-prolyl cis-trans isomerase-like 4 [Batrachochytrium dendrobatidis]KAK5669782.1 Peptidyl-prolyl cis-trans isomerase-like 4 [Batrachochytrium dendrobatidis]OAJ38310.1 hypothetical protein BDEG_22257 [Batrachochytrium dendrobatidis JEL423]